jgi:hypothetical protein
MRGFIAVFAMSLSVNYAVAEVVLAPEITGNGTIRIQRIESDMVMSDQMAALYGDAIAIDPGEYRLQFIPGDGGENEIYFVDVKVNDDGTATMASFTTAVSSSVLARQQARVSRLDTSLAQAGNIYSLPIPGTLPTAPKLTTVRAVPRASNWATKIAEDKPLTVNIVTVPPKAEIWINDEKSDYRTDAKLSIPKAANDLFLAQSIMLRKTGYANKVIPITEQLSDETINIELIATKP